MEKKDEMEPLKGSEKTGHEQDKEGEKKVDPDKFL